MLQLKAKSAPEPLSPVRDTLNSRTHTYICHIPHFFHTERPPTDCTTITKEQLRTKIYSSFSAPITTCLLLLSMGFISPPVEINHPHGCTRAHTHFLHSFNYCSVRLANYYQACSNYNLFKCASISL